MGCDSPVGLTLGLAFYFNPRTHVGCDAYTIPTLGDPQFQSTHPRGVRPYSPQLLEQELQFQSTHPRGVRQISWSPTPARRGFQSTHPRGVRPLVSQKAISESLISIHAPTWGATQQGSFLQHPVEFQSTHPRGVRLPSVMYVMPILAFQSTHPRGVRL